MKWCRLLALITFATTLKAQRAVSFSGMTGLAVGDGRGGEYDARQLIGFQFAGAVRYMPRRLGIFLDLSRDNFAQLGAGDAVCRPDASGQCFPGYPGLSGWSAALGVVARPFSFAEARVGVGPAWYRVTSVSQVAATPVTAKVGVIDVALYPLRHVGIGMGLRMMDLGRYLGDPLSTRSISVGIRVR